MLIFFYNYLFDKTILSSKIFTIKIIYKRLKVALDKYFIKIKYLKSFIIIFIAKVKFNCQLNISIYLKIAKLILKNVNQNKR